MEIIHIMKDGTVRESIEGIVIPPGEFYQVLNGILEKSKNKKSSNGGNTYERSCNH